MAPADTHALLIRDARVLTLAPPHAPGADAPAHADDAPRRGKAMSDLGVLPSADVLVINDRIAALGPDAGDACPPDATTLDAGGRVLMPAFVDCHTHACAAGSRLDEWERKLAGATYLDILRAGGGIMSTVRATRAASLHDLTSALCERLVDFMLAGTTTVEVKSGYGLTTESELNMLRAVRAAREGWPGAVLPTAMIGHALDPEQPDFVERTIRETLPAVSAEFPGVPIDAYCEQGAWSVDECVRLFEAARAAGHPVRVHADQFNSLGMVREAVRLGARSVDHLEASTPEDLDLLAASDTMGVVMPVCGLHLDGRYAKVRRFIDAGGALALATNSNPGSAPTCSMPLAIALGVRFCGLTVAEAIAACTVNAARLLGLRDRGTIQPGVRADLILLRHTDERSLAFELGSNPVDAVICAGQLGWTG